MTNLCEVTFKADSLFAHDSSNSCGVLTAYQGSKSFTVKKQTTNCNSWILVLDVTIWQWWIYFDYFKWCPQQTWTSQYTDK